MIDIQKQFDQREININEVGITNLKIPLYFPCSAKKQLVICSTTMGVRLPGHQKGTHMSRFVQIAMDSANSQLDKKLIKKVLQKIKNELKTDFAKIEFAFTIFLNKTSPVSQKNSLMNYDCKIIAKLTQDNSFLYHLEVIVPIATLCPCSKEISKYGAHNQRAGVFIKLQSKNYISPVEVIQLIEQTASSSLYAMLKREDEKFVTEKMYEQPRFVEDIVRDAAILIKKDERIIASEIKCISYESIHNHDAYALIINNKK